MSTSTVAIIPARGGSKGVPGKNVRFLGGKPLIAYSILAALECPHVSRCLVSTDDQEIKQTSIQWGAEVIDRPAEFATDTAQCQDVVRHVLSVLGRETDLPDLMVLLQPTSPLRTTRHLQRCMDSFLQGNYASAVSVTETEHHPYKCLVTLDGKLAPLHDNASLSMPRQLLPSAFRQNGAIYVVRTKEFLAHNSFYIPPAMPFIMDRQESIDIDSEIDFFLAEHYLKCSAGSVSDGSTE